MSYTEAVPQIGCYWLWSTYTLKNLAVFVFFFFWGGGGSVIYSWGGGSFSWGDTSKPWGGGGPECHFFPNPIFHDLKLFFYFFYYFFCIFFSNFFPQKTTVTPLRKKNPYGETRPSSLGWQFQVSLEGWGRGIVNVIFFNSPKINLLKPVNISARCGPFVCVCWTRKDKPIFSPAAGKIRGEGRRGGVIPPPPQINNARGWREGYYGLRSHKPKKKKRKIKNSFFYQSRIIYG